MQHIETVTLASATSSIVFSSIPQDGTDLVILFSGRSTGNNVFSAHRDVNITFNSISIGYSQRFLAGTGSSAFSDTTSGVSFVVGAAMPDSDTTANTFNSSSIYIPNYAGSANKSVSFDTVTENNATEAQQMIVAGLLSNTAAITSITLAASVDNMAIGSSASLYKITAGSDGTTVVT